jgi:hypothetical protein
VQRWIKVCVPLAFFAGEDCWTHAFAGGLADGWKAGAGHRRHANNAYAAAKNQAPRDDDVLGAGLAPAIWVVAVAPSLMDPPIIESRPRNSMPQRIAAIRSSGSTSPRRRASVILGLAMTMTFVSGTVISVDADSLL